MKALGLPLLTRLPPSLPSLIPLHRLHCSNESVNRCFVSHSASALIGNSSTPPFLPLPSLPSSPFLLQFFFPLFLHFPRYFHPSPFFLPFLLSPFSIQFMPFPLLARKVKKLASQHLLQLKHLLGGGRGFLKFKQLYRLKEALGHGGFGIVYRAVRISDQMPVAVKFIERHTVREWGKLDDHRVPMEAVMLARCSDVSGVIRLIDWFSLPEGFLIVMERPIPCMDLFDFIHHQKKLDEDLARFLFRPIVRTVVDLAERKVLHRDLKDENILINLTNGQIKLIDFGAATVFTRNRCHDFQGTRLYCPPEWFLHSLYLAREATVWSLGVLLFNMLNGRLPFLNEKDICTAHLLGPLPFFAPLSKAARDLVAQCLCFEASSRPSLQQILTHPWLNNEQDQINWCQLNACCSQLPMTEFDTDDQRPAESSVSEQRDKITNNKNGLGRESGLDESFDEHRPAKRLHNGSEKENCAFFSRQSSVEVKVIGPRWQTYSFRQPPTSNRGHFYEWRRKRWQQGEEASSDSGTASSALPSSQRRTQTLAQ